MKINEKIVLKNLEKVMDPELNISVIDLGLIYKVSIDENSKVNITMTLTTPGCPLYKMIEDEIKNKILSLGAKKVNVKIVFNPPWNTDMMSKKGKKKLGF